MTASRDPDRLIHGFLLEGEEELQDRVYDAVRAEIEHTRQRTVFGLRRTPTMNRFLAIGAAAVAVLVMVVIGSQMFRSPTNSGLGGTASPTPQPTPTPSPVARVLASGSFTAGFGEFGEAFDIEATRTGDDVSGTLDVTAPSGADGAYSVDLQCAQTTDQDVLLIGGQVTESTYTEFIEPGAYVVISFAPGAPVRMLWAVDALVTDEVPAPAESCAAYIERLLDDPEWSALDVHIYGRPIQGVLELGD
jgi:hypothetical protein